MNRPIRTSLIEEISNAITHGLGAIAGIVGLVFLILKALSQDGNYRFWSLLIFGATMVFLYLASTLYHSLIFTKVSNIFKKIDYIAISLFIAGTYTPIALIPMRHQHGPLLLLIIWILTITNIIWQFIGRKKELISLILYLVTGWTMILFIKPLSQQISQTALILLFLGGVSYTIGTIFYRWNQLAFNHTIWHMFVILGSVCHFMTIMRV